MLTDLFMFIPDTWTIIYLAVGFLISFVHYKCVYERDIEEKTKNENFDYPMFSFVMGGIIVFWPVCIVYYYFMFLKNVRNRKWKL